MPSDNPLSATSHPYPELGEKQGRHRSGIATYIGRHAELYWVVALRRDKSCGRVADKFGLRAWTINLRTWIFRFTCLVFKTTCIDAEKPLHEGAFFFTRMALSLPLDKRNTRNKTKGLRITSERYIGELGHDALAL